MPSRRRRTRISRVLVIDASVAQASGGVGASYPRSKRCRDLLESVLKICHKAAWTPEIREEWRGRASKFARKWRTRMEARKKMERRMSVQDDDLRGGIEINFASRLQRDAAEKDAPLIEAALATDRIILSLDDEARRIFASLAAQLSRLGDIQWLNPADESANVLGWLEGGCEFDQAKSLVSYERA